MFIDGLNLFLDFKRGVVVVFTFLASSIMFPLTRIIRSDLWIIQKRWKSKVHWAKLKKKIGSEHRAMAHFDDFYGSVFGERWEPMRKALLRNSKYVALVNNYGDVEDTVEMLTNKGAHCLKRLTDVDRAFRAEYHSMPDQASETKKDKSQQVAEAIETYSAKTQEQEIAALYPGEESPDALEAQEFTLRKEKESADQVAKHDKDENRSISAYNTSMERALSEAELDSSRIIDADVGLTSEALYQHSPATKLMGKEDWVPESQHYAYYSHGKDFPLQIVAETELVFPEHLKVFTYELENVTLFPEPRRGATGVFNYYPLDGGSVVAVLALGLRPGDRVLDLCAAPGGKTMVALQTLYPDRITAVDSSISRRNRMERILRDYLPDYATDARWRERVQCHTADSRVFQEGEYDKVLVDVPCTTDRHSVTVSENSIFRADRVKERLRIPELQSALLQNALRLARVGGTVVYSTCSLSPVQNDGVVHLAMKRAFEQDGIRGIIKDLSAPLSAYRSMMRFGAGAATPRYGALVVPHVAANFGPTYFAKIDRVA